MSLNTSKTPRSYEEEVLSIYSELQASGLVPEEDGTTTQDSPDECEDGKCGECDVCCAMAFANSLGIGDITRDRLDIWVEGGVVHVNLVVYSDGSTTSPDIQAVPVPKEQHA